MKQLARGMCLVLAFVTLPRAAEATGEKAAPSELSELAAWQAASPDAAAFEGGDAGGVLLFIVLVAAIVLIVYLIVEHDHHAMASPLDAAESPAPPPLFR